MSGDFYILMHISLSYINRIKYLIFRNQMIFFFHYYDLAITTD